MDDSGDRHRLFEAARLRTGLGVRQLWLDYVALGGRHGVFEIEAYLEGLIPLDAGQQDVLAVALNERLDDLYRTARVPYLFDLEGRPCQPPTASTVVDELLQHRRAHL